MNFQGHIAGGIAAGLIYSGVLRLSGYPIQEALPIPLTVTVLASIFPDSDTKSTPTRIFAVFGLVLSVWEATRGQFLHILSYWCIFGLAQASKHRGWTHSYFLPVAIMFSPFPTYMVAAGAIGLIVHYLLDDRYPWEIRNWRLF